MSIRALLILIGLATSSMAREPNVDKIDSPEEAKPEKIALLESEGGMQYFLRVPKSYDDREGSRLILFLHGSSMNGLQYLNTFESNKWCRDDILVCPNGEQGDDPFGAHNFGFESAPLVAEITKTIQDSFKTQRTYIGGHSQGGFLTYSVIMHHPELYQAAFPMAGDCWSQNEPNLWEDDPEKLAKQKEIAIAVIHGQSDSIVNFSQGEHAYGIFLAMAYPKLRFFAPEKLGHQFGLSPVPEALEWLDAMTGFDPESAMDLTKTWFKDEEWGWMHQAALAVASDKDADFSSSNLADKAIAAVEREATSASESMKESMASKEPKEWIPEWFEFRRQFGSTDAASPLVTQYDESRAKERDTGAQLFFTARGEGQNGDNSAMKTTLEKLLNDAPHTFHTWYALDWLD